MNKADLVKDPESFITQAKEVALDCDVITVSTKTASGIENLEAFLEPGLTVAFLGSSGVGKSSLVNTLTGSETLETNEVREKDSRGRHTTTHREMITLPSGAILIDTPGMRELSLLASEQTLDNVFAEIEVIAQNCKYNNCDHVKSDGCAVKKAITDETISEERYLKYLKLKKEIRYNKQKKETAHWDDRKRRTKGIRF